MAYILLSALLGVISLIPLRLLYIISDFLKFLVCHVFKYRRRVVEHNLVSSFPEKPKEWIAKTTNAYYAWLMDYIVETLKMNSMSARQMKKRMKVLNPEAVNDAVARGRSVVLYLGHYCNWEWVASLPLVLSPDCIPCQVYHPLENKTMDKWFMKLRTRFHSHNIAMDDIMRRLIEIKRAGKCSVTGFIADQAPGHNVHLWLDFLNHETGVYTGPERIARFLDAECFYCYMSRPKRGYYTLEFIPVTSAPKKEEQFEITRRYFEMLQDNIEKYPQYWLWSHRRWKRSRRDFNEYWGDKAAQQLSHL